MSTLESQDMGHLLRELAPQVLAAVVRRHHDFAAAEDAVQEALAAAASQWPSEGVPRNPRGWLYHVAVRRLTDIIRSEIARQRREDEVATELWADWAFVSPPDVDVPAEPDDAVVLLFMCCHPSLTPPSAIALTLRAVGGLTTAEIARAFLVPDATMAQRISRAKLTIKAAGASFSLPSDFERPGRLCSVLHVLYLMFNEGYTSSSGATLQRTDLSNEAIRLTRSLRAAAPNDAEVSGLLALMLLTDARRAARTGPVGELIPLDEQDRTLWDREMIAEGVALVSEALPMGAVGSYQLQAAIAAVHSEAPSTDETDWRQIVLLYDLLMRLSDNPVVALNRAVAVAMVEGPERGLDLLASLEHEPRLQGSHRLDAVRGHLLERAGDRRRAVTHFLLAAEATSSEPERNYLRLKAARLTAAL